NTTILRLFIFEFLAIMMLGMYSCETKVVHYDVSLQQIDSLLNANGEVHIQLPTGTNIELVESGDKQKGQNMSPGSNGNNHVSKDVFSGIRQTIGTQIMSAYAVGTYQC